MDRINALLPAADLARALDHLQQARAVLAPYLQPLTPAFVPGFIDFNELKQA